MKPRFSDFVRMTEMATQKKIKVKKKKKIKSGYPVAKERVYAEFIKSIIKPFTVFIDRVVIPNMGELKSRYDQEEFFYPEEMLPGSFDLVIRGGVPGVVKSMNDIEKIIFEKNAGKLKARLEEFGYDLWDDNLDFFQGWIRDITGVLPPIDLTGRDSMVELFVEQNTNLIKGLSQELQKNTSTIISQGIQEGKSINEIADSLRGISDRFEGYRANLIARDQVSSYWGDLERRKQKEIGVELYIWRTAQDERVRDSHEVLEGMFCKWDDVSVYSEDGKEWRSRGSIGAVEKHPGNDFNCRCYAEPVLSFLLED